MASGTQHPVDRRLLDVQSAADRALIERELEAILHSPLFRSSRRCQDFLQFVVRETLEGRSEAIKERSIAMAVFERGNDYEPAADSIVRVKAIEVRKKLAEYYETHPERDLRIELNPGRYVPSFHPWAVPAAPVIRAVWIRAGFAAVAIVAVAIAMSLWLRAGRTGYVEQLWAPIMGRDHVVLLALPSPTIQQVENGQTRVKEQYYVGEGAAFGAAVFAGILGAKHQLYQVKVGREVSFVDLRRQPTILLGAYSSPLTIDLTKTLRFRFRPHDSEPVTSAIVDSADSKRQWTEPSFQGSRDIRESYSMAVRIFDSGSGQMVMIAAGINARGTHTAAEFLTSETALADFTRRAGRDWLKKNFQIVLHSQIHEHVPGPPEVLAWHIW